jgi:hypothetical protein
MLGVKSMSTLSFVMDRSEQPATEIQLKRLHQLGHHASQLLSREEASRLIREMEDHKGLTRAFELRKQLEHMRLALCGALREEEAMLESQLEELRTMRREYWINSCREPAQMHDASNHVLTLYMKYGCRFTTPSFEQAQEVLDALDAAMTTWDAEHPELFYRTLELNFPELLKRT